MLCKDLMRVVCLNICLLYFCILVFLLLAEVTNKYADIDNSVLLEKC